ncbi:unnamed protein product [Withania somnifera]
MKFGRILMMLMALIAETLPEWQDKFLSYKDLKKQLKLIYPNKQQKLNDDKPDDGIDKKEVNDFLNLLEKEIDKFNNFFLGKEEEYVIDLKVSFSFPYYFFLLVCCRLVKILKKYDKRTGALIRLPVIQKVLEEPFFKTDVLNKLVKECETMLSSLFSQNEPSKAGGEGSCGGGSNGVDIGESSSRVEDTDELAENKNRPKAPEGEGSIRGGSNGRAGVAEDPEDLGEIENGTSVAEDPEDLGEIENPSNKTPGGEGSSGVKDPEEFSEIDSMGNMYLKLTKSALRVLQEIRSGSSTVSMFSLPPMERMEMHKVWKNIPVKEQAAE